MVVPSDESEVEQDRAPVTDEDVRWFDVTMDVTGVVEHAKPGDELCEGVAQTLRIAVAQPRHQVDAVEQLHREEPVAA